MAKQQQKALKENKKFDSIAEIEKAILKIGRRVKELKELDERFDDKRLSVVRDSIVETLREVYGANSANFEPYEHFHIWSGPIIAGMAEGGVIKCQKEGIKEAIVDLEGHISRLEEKKEDFDGFSNLTIKQGVNVVSDNFKNKVFIVHGHDSETKYAVSNVIHQLGLEPIILHEQASGSKTIIEKLEHYSDVDFAVVLLTPDDEGHPKGKANLLKPRARQNVILELGFFMAKISRGRVCALHGADVELPSDYQGILYIPIDEQGAWKFQLGKEIKAAGLPAKLDGLNL